MTVREALTRSVNLVFIRLMRDVVHNVMARSEGESAALIDDPSNPRRQEYLARFADKEGRQFVARFHRKYKGKSAEEAEELLVRSARPTPARLAAAFYGLEPDADVDGLGQFIARRLPNADLSDAALQALRDKLGPGRWSLADRGYLAGVHPLELWVAAHLREHPKATLGEAIAASVRATAGRLPVAVQDAPQGGAGHAHPQPARSGRLRRDPAVVAAPGLSLRLADAVVRDRARCIGRPTCGAGRADGHHRQPRRAPAGDARGVAAVRAATRRTRRDWSTSQRRPSECSSPRSPTCCARALIGVVEDGTAKRLKGALVRQRRQRGADRRQDGHGRPAVRHPRARRPAHLLARREPFGHLGLPHRRPPTSAR